MGDTKGKQRDSGEVVIQNIIDNYKQLEQSIVSQLKLCNDLHPGTTGSSREDVWLQLFEMIVPKKFVIEHSIFIIDSCRHVSKEVDLAIIDNNYTPYIFQFGRLKYVPIEAVAAVVECKSTSIKFQEENTETGKVEAGMTAWCNSIEQLRTSRESIARMATGTVVNGNTYSEKKPLEENSSSTQTCIQTSTQTSTRPIRIFCGYNTELSDESKKRKEICKFFDFVLLAKEGDKKKINIITSNLKSADTTASNKEEATLKDWYKELDHYKYEDKKKIIENEELGKFNLSQFRVQQEGEDISLLSFNFQLNQLLMLINNPMLFPHLGYVKMFNQKGKDETC